MLFRSRGIGARDAQDEEHGVTTFVDQVVLHLAAIAYYQWVAHVNVVGPMLHGNLAVDEPIPAPAQSPAWLAMVLAAIAAAAVYALVVVYPRG